MAHDGSDSRADDENRGALRKLAARLLTAQNIQDEQAAAPPRIFVGRLPEDLPVEVPISDGADVVGGVARDLSRGRRDAEIVLDAALSAERFREDYRRQLLAAGWDEDTELFGLRSFVPPGLPGLFHLAASRSGRLRRFLRGRVPGLPGLFPVVFRSGGYKLMVSAHDRPDAPTDVRLHLFTSRRGPWTGDEPALEILPSLVPPSDARRRRREISNFGVLAPPHDARRPGGNFGGSGRPENDAAYSYIALETGLDLTALTAHYAAQLERAGWSRVEEGHAGPQAWSAWTFTGGDGNLWTGTFTALRLPATPARYLLQINAVRTSNH
ncbi:MAG: hypothetical protein ACR2JR_10475 [Rubrobacteraceae bacterium]